MLPVELLPEPEVELPLEDVELLVEVALLPVVEVALLPVVVEVAFSAGPVDVALPPVLPVGTVPPVIEDPSLSIAFDITAASGGTSSAVELFVAKTANAAPFTTFAMLWSTPT